MMFLQYFIQGCYFPIASLYVQNALGFTAYQVGFFGTALALGPILTPFLFGQLIDRFFATERVLAVCHIVGGLLMLLLFTQTNVWIVIGLGAVYSVLYVPTMMLTNALAFHHLRNSDREFPLIRLWGTIGFVLPAWWIEMVWLAGLEGNERDIGRGLGFMLAGATGVAMGLYSLSLPHTPPQPGKARDFAPGAVMKAFFTRWNLFILLVTTLLIAIAHQFFFTWNSPFLREILRSGGWETAAEQRIASIGQICEVAVMAGVGLAIVRLGFKPVMLVGALAYTARCLILAAVFAFEIPFAARLGLAVVGQALHGFCFGCFLAAAFMYIDNVIKKDLRGSMQTLYGTCILGFGFFLGGLVGGWTGKLFTTGVGGPTLRESFGVAATAGLVEYTTFEGNVEVRDWPGIWLTSALIAAAALVLFATAFPRQPATQEMRGEAAPAGD
ncbi:MAG: MFS transporter [Planctomycetes bacterium]|nr:MFS transporter [Planctomycetota bacterium]